MRRLGLAAKRLRLITIACMALVVLAVGACGGAGDDDTTDAGTPASTGSKKLVINSFGGSWGEAIQVGLIDQFEQQTGIEVELLSTADAAKSKLAVERGNEPPEDILDTDFATVQAMSGDDLLAPVDYEAFDDATLAKIPEFAQQEYGLAWGEFAIGLCYDKTKFPGAKPESWADFWNFSKFPGKRGMLEWPAEPQPEFGLLAAGVTPDSLYPIDTDKAFAQLEALKPHVPQFAKDPAALQQQLLDGTVIMEACYTHRVQKLIDSGAEQIAISYNQARLNNEYFLVWNNAPNKENAMKFLAFIMEAKPQATWARIGNTGPINPDAYELLPEEIQAKLPTAPAYRDKTFPNDDAYWATDTGDGKTNQETIIDDWGDELGG